MPTRACPVCGKQFEYTTIKDHPTYPFCSERCRQAELVAWLEGRYVISRPLEEGEGEDRTEGPAVERQSSRSTGERTGREGAPGE